MRPKFLHVCIPQCARGRKRGREGEHTKQRNRGTERKKKRRREGARREDLSQKVEQQKQAKEMDKEEEGD